MIKFIITKIKDNRVLKNIFNLSILQVVSALLSLGLIPLLAKILEPKIFGLVMFIHLITNYFIWFVDWGFSQGGTQKVASIRSNLPHLSKIFNQIYTAQLFLIGISIIPLLLSFIFFQFKYQFEHQLIVVIIGYFILSSCMPIWFLNGLERVTFALLVQIYPKFIAIISVFLIIKSPNDYMYYFYALNLGLIIANFHIFFVIRKDHQITFNFADPFLQLKNNFNYFITSFTKTLGNNIIPFFLGIFTSIELFGIYSLADKIKGAVLIILNPIFQSVFPRMCNVVNQKSYKSYLKKYSIIILTINIILAICIYLLIELIIKSYIGLEYQLSSTLVKLMIPSIFLSSILSIIFYFILIPFDASNSLMKISIFQFFLILLMAPLVINIFDIYGAIISLTMSELFLVIFYLFIITKKKLLKNGN